jgi:hypothetical protein
MTRQVLVVFVFATLTALPLAAGNVLFTYALRD